MNAEYFLIHNSAILIQHFPATKIVSKATKFFRTFAGKETPLKIWFK